MDYKNLDYKKAVKLLEDGNGISLRDYFKENNFLLEYGYTYLLDGNLDKAYEILSTLTSPRAEWASYIIPFLQGLHGSLPTFFQIRNFLEIDIALFLKYKKTDYVQKLIDIADFMQDINSETYKFIARVLFKHGYMNASKIFMDKSANYYYKDVELHYLYVEFYLAHNDRENALKALRTCLRINPEYYPAVKMDNALRRNTVCQS